jgi:hypothetical protein
LNSIRIKTTTTNIWRNLIRICAPGTQEVFGFRATFILLAAPAAPAAPGWSDGSFLFFRFIKLRQVNSLSSHLFVPDILILSCISFSAGASSVFWRAVFLHNNFFFSSFTGSLTGSLVSTTGFLPFCLQPLFLNHFSTGFSVEVLLWASNLLLNKGGVWRNWAGTAAAF